MNFDRLFRRAELSRNLLVQHAGSNQLHHFELTRREQVEKLPGLVPFRGAAPFIGRSRQCAFNALKQVGISERLRKKIDCARLHRLGTHGNVAVPCDKDELFMPAPLNQSFLKLDAIKPWHPNIDNHTGRAGVWTARQKIRGRAEDLAPVASGAEQSRQPFSNGGVIVDYKNQAIGRNHLISHRRLSAT